VTLAARTFRPDPKPPKRVVDREAGREKVHAEGCRLTRRPYGSPVGSPEFVTRFHVVPRDLGGGDVEENIVGIVSRIHDLWEHDFKLPGTVFYPLDGTPQRVGTGKEIYGPQIWKVLYTVEREYALDMKGADFVRRYYYVDLT
jgi:hypothetical protein